jgi:outer membrane protein TolC
MNLAQAQEGLRLAEVGYKSGVRTEVEVMDARTALTRTQMVHGQALYGHMMARLSLTHAMGTLESANEINKIENVPAAANGTGLTPDREQ